MSASPGQPANMVRLADSGVLIWLIIFVMISLAKGWSKLQESKESQSPEPDDDAPPPVPPTPPVPRPQPRPASIPMPRVPRAVPPTIRRPTPQSAPASTPAARKVSADDIRRVVEKMGRKPQPTAPVPLPSHSVPAPSVVRAEPPSPPPLPSPLEAPAQKQTIADLSAAALAKADAPPLAPSSRASQWTEALRDRQNIRNIIVAYEIIGPPRAELV